MSRRFIAPERVGVNGRYRFDGAIVHGLHRPVTTGGTMRRVDVAARSRRRLARQAEPTGADALLTTEAALVTLAGVARAGAAAGALALDADDLALLEATQCQDEAHVHLLQSLGAVPAVTAFALLPALTGDRAALFAALLALKEIALGAQMALARALARTAADPALAETLFAMGAVEGGHRVLLRARLDRQPAGDRAFVRWRFADPVAALAALAEAGMLDDAPDAVPYPGPLERRCAGVFGLVPQTTDDELRWRDALRP